MAKILYLDLETTGTDETLHKIYQLSGIIEIDGEEVYRFDYKIHPGEHTPVEPFVYSQWLSHGISIEDILSYQHPSIVIPEFISVLERYIDRYDKKDKFFICGYNVHFDERFLRVIWLEFGNRFFDAYFWSNKLDVMVLAGYVLMDIRNKLSNFQLSTLCKIFNIPIKAHDSMSDIIATKNLYLALKNYLEVKDLGVN